MKMKQKINDTLSGLKDFQVATMDYVYEQFYTVGRNRMLIADEVGLGKTIIAKGIIAKAYAAAIEKDPKSHFSVVYICSNQALAAQNLQKLNFTDDPGSIDFSSDDDRVTSLAYEGGKPEAGSFMIKAFTPATSFDTKTHVGKADERVLLYRLLYQDPVLASSKNKLKWILIGGGRLKTETWDKKIQDAEYFDKDYDIKIRKIKKEILIKFKRKLKEPLEDDDLPNCRMKVSKMGKISLFTLLKYICDLPIQKNNFLKYYMEFGKELISALRFRLSQVCLEFLHVDIFILDEFQRYKQLIANASAENDENLSQAVLLARDIFSLPKAKILMLSATPFKPYTSSLDEQSGEIHYEDFQIVLEFLLGKQLDTENYKQDRKTFFGFLRHPETLKASFTAAFSNKIKLEKHYRQAICRTERLLVSAEKNSMVFPDETTIEVTKEDIDDFRALDAITVHLNEKHNTSLMIPLEYVKSAPFAFSFLENYAHRERLKKFITGDADLEKLLMKNRHNWLNMDDIKNYNPLNNKKMPNAKIRLLLEKSINEKGWQYLWIPPSVPYYESEGAFKDSRGFSKTLIFSSWKMVPRMVASLVSYEAERLSVGNKKSISEKENQTEKRKYFLKRRSPQPQFTFKINKKDDGPQQMNNFMLTFPAPYLSKLYDPKVHLKKNHRLSEIKKSISLKILEILESLDINRFATGEGDWRKWYWLAPLILERELGDSNEISKWLNGIRPDANTAVDGESDEGSQAESTGKSKHFEQLQELYNNKGLLPVGKLQEGDQKKLANHLADLIIGSPAICMYRALSSYDESEKSKLDSAYIVSMAFISMFNKPESIAIVRLTTDNNDYWQQVLDYCKQGNLQAMLDEYIYLLRDCENIKSVEKITEYFEDNLTIRSALIKVDGLQSFLDSVKNQTESKRFIRTHYAMDFGVQKIQTAKGAGRQINVRQAFNSPFRPFVLATTSIGQEGLDFHLYCKKIIHWNLPSNPIDFEQREGRINRYKGYAIRQNIATKYKQSLALSDAKNVWDELFTLAEKEKELSPFPCDLIPFWHTESDKKDGIERIVPLYPLSRDKKKYQELLKVLSLYRLTFGQPRQDELIDAIDGSSFTEEERKNIYELMIDLSPISFQKKKI